MFTKCHQQKYTYNETSVCRHFCIINYGRFFPVSPTVKKLSKVNTRLNILYFFDSVKVMLV